MTDTTTSQNIGLSSWDTLYFNIQIFVKDNRSKNFVTPYPTLFIFDGFIQSVLVSLK
jgi:hypothetical protein